VDEGRGPGGRRRSCRRTLMTIGGGARHVLPLPPGPTQGRLTQTVMLARDPLRTLQRLRSRFGPVFTVRTTNGPMVVVGAARSLSP
jgi:hypothetical protein